MSPKDVQPVAKAEMPKAVLVTVTERAAQELKAALATQENVAGVRLGAAGGGCCGPGYALALAEKPDADDLVVEAGGVKVFVSPQDADRVRGAVLNFVETPMGSGFHIENPNQEPREGAGHGHGHGHGQAHGGCACGAGGCGC